MLHVLAQRDVAGGGSIVEATLAMRTLNVVGILAGRRRRQIRQLSTSGQMSLHLLSRADCLDEVLVLDSPVLVAGLGRNGAGLCGACS